MPSESRRPLDVLTILLYWYPYSGPMTPIYAGLLRDLKQRGHKVTIISSFPHYRSGATQTWQEHRGKLYEKTEWEGIDLYRTWVFAPVFRNERLGLVFRAGNFVSFTASSLIAGILLRRKVDVVLTLSSPPLVNGLVGWAVARSKGGHSVHNVVDVYPDMAERMGVWDSWPVMNTLKGVERLVYAVSDKVVALSDTMRENILGKGVPPDKVEVIPIFVDIRGVYPKERDNDLARSLGLTGKTVVLYAGNVGVPHGVEILIEAADRMRARKDLLFCILGRGENKDRIVRMARERSLENVVFPPHQPDDMVPYVWASGDICAVTYAKGAAEFSLPSKMVHAMAAARPVVAVADEGSDARKLVDAAGCGVSVLPGDPQALCRAIELLAEDPGRRREMGERGHAYALEHFDRKAVTDRFERLFRDLAEP